MANDLVISDETQMKIMQALNNNKSFNQGDFIANLNILSSKVSSMLTGSPAEKNNELRTKFDAAKKNLRDAPEAVVVAERNYYVYDKGQTAYNTMLYDRFAKTAQDFQTNSMALLAQFMRDLNLLIEHYRISTLQNARIEELLKVRRKENKNLLKQVHDYKGYVHTNARKVIYEENDQTQLQTVRSVIVFIYYALLVLYLIFGNFFPNAQYKNRNMWIALILYVVLPFVFNWFVKKMFALTNFVTDLWHKIPYPRRNVYVNL